MKMLWNQVALLYDFFETMYNSKVYREFPVRVAEYIGKDDEVLECACGTGIITKCMAEKGAKIVATDYSEGMLKQARKKYGHLDNVTFCNGNIMQLQYADGSFDKVVAGNILHLLDNPKGALDELVRVCRKGGLIIVPTYVNKDKTGKPTFIVRLLKIIGLDFKMHFTFSDYKSFISSFGYPDAAYYLVEGKMPNAIAIITKK